MDIHAGFESMVLSIKFSIETSETIAQNPISIFFHMDVPTACIICVSNKLGIINAEINGIIGVMCLPKKVFLWHAWYDPIIPQLEIDTTSISSFNSGYVSLYK